MSRRPWTRAAALVGAGSMAFALNLGSGLAGPARAAAATQDGARVIVLLREPPAAEQLPDGRSAAKDRMREIRRGQDRVIGTARDRGVSLDPSRRYTTVLNGFAATIDDPADIDTLRGLPEVAAVLPDQQVEATLASAVPHVGAPEMWDRQDSDGDAVDGTGSVVAVLDTGIDYDHPDLGGCLGEQCRVLGGYDFYNGDADPDDDNYHGTHVAGIIGARGGVTGVAPGVSFLAYKVLSRSGRGWEADVLAGLDAATSPDTLHRPDVINMSLSSPGGMDSPTSLAVQNATEAGFMVVTAAGNDGPGPKSVESPSAAPGAFVVGASTTGVISPDVQVVSPAAFDPHIVPFPFSANAPTAPIDLALVDVGKGTDADYARVGDVRGKAVLVNGGEYPYWWLQAAVRAEAHGATLALVMADDPYGSWDPQRTGVVDPADADEGRLDSTVAAGLTTASAKRLRDYLAQGGVTVRLSGEDVTDEIASFSSRGPTPDYLGAPDIVAPGVNIRSTVPVEEVASGYGYVSGTSMAAPMVSGAAALLFQANTDWSARDVEDHLTAGARKVDAAPLAQGAGRLDIPAAADAVVLPDRGFLSMGLADIDVKAKASGKTTLSLRNTSAATQTVTLRVLPATGTRAKAGLSRSSLKLGPGQAGSVDLKATASQIGGGESVTGWVEVSVKGGRTMTVPYSLEVRPLSLLATPDPGVGRTEIFVGTPIVTADAPEVTLSGPQGYRRTVTAHQDAENPLFWRAEFTGLAAGDYTATAVTTVPGALGQVSLAGYTPLEIISTAPSGSWDPVGPWSADGEMAPAPQGGDDMLVASETSATMFRTTDGGATWEQLHNLPVAGANGFGAEPDLVADPSSSTRYYLGVDGFSSDPTYAGALLVTENFGDTWTRLPYPGGRIYDLKISPDGRVLAIASDDSILISRDAGATWETVSLGSDYVTTIAIDGDRLYAGTARGLLGFDGLRQPQLSEPEVLLVGDGWNEAIGRVVARGGVVFGWDTRTGGSIWRSGDAGASFAKVLTPGTEWTTGHRMVIAGDDVWATSPLGLWKAAGMGATFTAIPNVLGDTIGDVESFDGRTLIGGDAGLYELAPDGSVTRTGVQGADGLALALTEQAGGPALLVGTQWGVYDTALGSDGHPVALEWGATEGEGEYEATVSRLAVHPSDPTTVYGVNSETWGGEKVLKSTDGGRTWSELVTVSSEVTAVLVHPADPQRIYVAYKYYDLQQGYLVTSDGGRSWLREQTDEVITALAGDPQDVDRLYVGTRSGLSVSTDGGRTLQPRLGEAVTAIEVDPDDPRRILVGGDGLWMSTDRAGSFKKSGTTAARLSVSDIVFGEGKAVYAATAHHAPGGLVVSGRGVLASRNDGRTFTSLSDGLGSLDARALQLSGDQLFVGLGGGGVYVLDLGR